MRALAPTLMAAVLLCGCDRTAPERDPVAHVRREPIQPMLSKVDAAKVVALMHCRHMGRSEIGDPVTIERRRMKEVSTIVHELPGLDAEVQECRLTLERQDKAAMTHDKQ